VDFSNRLCAVDPCARGKLEDIKFLVRKMCGVIGLQENRDHRLFDSTRKPSSGTDSRLRHGEIVVKGKYKGDVIHDVIRDRGIMIK
jgi:hypothetical protein